MHLHPGANRVQERCTRVQRQKCTRVQGVQTHPGAYPGKAHISTALEPDWKFIFFSREATRSGEHIVHIDKDENSLFLIKRALIPISPELDPRQPWRCPAHLLTDGIQGDARITFDDQFIVNVPADKAVR